MKFNLEVNIKKVNGIEINEEVASNENVKNSIRRLMEKLSKELTKFMKKNRIDATITQDL